MAKYIVPSTGDKPILIKCRTCKTLYAPDRMMADSNEYNVIFEPCPICGEDHNKWKQIIPLWRYNLIKWFRGGKYIEQTDDRGADD